MFSTEAPNSHGGRTGAALAAAPLLPSREIERCDVRFFLFFAPLSRRSSRPPPGNLWDADIFTGDFLFFRCFLNSLSVLARSKLALLLLDDSLLVVLLPLLFRMLGGTLSSVLRPTPPGSAFEGFLSLNEEGLTFPKRQPPSALPWPVRLGSKS